MTKKKQKFSQNKTILLATAVLLTIFVLPVVLSYTNFYPPCIDKKIIYVLDSVVADIPFLPKTPKQVVTKALIRNQNLSSYSLQTNINLETTKVKIVNVTITQAVENAGSLDTKSKSKIAGEIILLANGKIDLESVKQQSNFSFKISCLPSGLGVNAENLKHIWYQVDMKSFQEGLSVNTRNDQQIIDDVRNSFQKIQGGLVEKSIFSKVTSFKNVKLSSQNYYEIKFNLGEDSLKNLPMLGELKLKKPVLTLTVNSSSFYLTKINLDSEVVTGTNSALVLRLSTELSKIGQEQNIEEPKNQKEIKNPIDLALAFNSSENKTEGLFTATGQSKDLGENFLTVERLISVILLLPKSI